MLPVFAIMGRPNVGKSTLFNRLTKTKAALVANYPGLTRDRQYGNGTIEGQEFIVIDTGGIGERDDDLSELMFAQARLAMHEATAIIFVVDAKEGLTAADQNVVAELRRSNKPCFVFVNKVDGIDERVALLDFYVLGFTGLFPIAAVHGRGVSDAMRKVLQETKLPESELDEIAIKAQGIKMAMVGRPNVGKSTLINRMLGEDRVIVFDQAGTTRDSIYIPFTRHEKNYTLIDTAGIRRRGRVFEAIEKFSIVKTLQAIADAHVVVYLMDAQENVVDQDMHLLGYILESGKSLVLAVNKWDNLGEDQKNFIKNEIMRKLRFVDFAQLFFISALHGTNVGHLYKAVEKAYESAFIEIPTKKVTECLQKALVEHQPPMVNGRRLKLRYAHMGGHNPPIFVIHGTQNAEVPGVYQRYLMNYFREAFRLVGTPVQLEFKTGDNPFKHIKNPLTERQVRKRQRLMKFAK